MNLISTVYLLRQTGPEPVLFGDTITWFLIFTNLFVLIGGWVYFRWANKRFRDENKKLSEKVSERSYQVMMQKWELERKNISISQQNEEIIDSLNYARNIQYAILPKTESLKKHFTDAFVLYKPKDIVSGDFYFFEQVNDKIYLAVADCTGHGVAGAFMSMVGSSLLHQITGQKDIGGPDTILKKLNDGIVDALRQKETASHGGMDIALCCFDFGKMLVEFAGANRPLYMIRKYQADSIKPDKLPIGGFNQDEDRNFSIQSINLQPGDRLYLFSDGYADQFGGPDGKKIMTKKFKDLVLSIHESTMYQQQQTLEAYFENWKGKFEQVDDVLVVGIQI